MSRPSAKRDEILRLFKAGVNTTEIAQTVGCAFATVRRHTDPAYKEKHSKRAVQLRHMDMTIIREARVLHLREPAGRRLTNKALYDPARDGPQYHTSLTGALLGDPPAGRQKLLRDWEARNPDRRPGAHATAELFTPVFVKPRGS